MQKNYNIIMKVIGNFLQTYSNRRLETANYFSQDNTLNYLLNKVDHKFFSLHNTGGDLEYCKKYANIIKQKFKNVEFLVYNEPYYTHTVCRHIKMLKEKGCTDLFFTQDDVICSIPDKHKRLCDVVYNFYKNSEDINLLSLNVKGSRLIQCGVEPRQTRIVSKEHGIVAYEFLTTDFAKAKYYEMDDSTYFGKINLIEKLYDEKYMTYYNTDQAEGYVRERCEKEPISRWVFNKRMFRYFYYTGMHIYNRQKELRFIDRLLKYKVAN